MSRKFSWRARSAGLLTAAAASVAAFGGGVSALAEDEAQHEEGRIVGISPEGDADLNIRHRQDLIADDEAQTLPAYWLGIQGQPLQSDVLRTHLQLAEGVGIVIEDVVPGSPAEKAGLRRHDVLLNVGGEQISGMGVLQKAVADSNGKALDLKVIRLAKEETISVTPEAPPADLAAKMGAGRSTAQGGMQLGGMPLGGDDPMAQIQAMMKQLQQNGVGGGVRVFGPGMVMGGQGLNMAQVPSNVQVSVTREGDGPATVTVKRGEDTWTLKGDDKEAIAELPDDVRPFVEQMLQGGQSGGAGVLGGHLGGLDLKFNGRDLEALRETAESMIGVDAIDEGAAHEGRLRQRLEEMEKRLERFEKQFQENSDQEAADSSDPSA
jgi:membrane-associated protease RseP (regulator of RpoE activity)